MAPPGFQYLDLHNFSRPASTLVPSPPPHPHPPPESPSSAWDAHREQQPPKKKRKSKASREQYDVADMLRCLRGSGVATEKMVKEVYCNADSVGPTSDKSSSGRHHLLADLNSIPTESPEDTCHAEEQRSSIESPCPASSSAPSSPPALLSPFAQWPELSSAARDDMRVTMVEQQRLFAEQVKMLHELVDDQRYLCQKQEKVALPPYTQEIDAAHLFSKASEIGQETCQGRKTTALSATKGTVVSPRGSMSSSTCSLLTASGVQHSSASGNTKGSIEGAEKGSEKGSGKGSRKGSGKGGLKRKKQSMVAAPNGQKPGVLSAAEAGGVDRRNGQAAGVGARNGWSTWMVPESRSNGTSIKTPSIDSTKSKWAAAAPVSEPLLSSRVDISAPGHLQHQMATAPPAPLPSLPTDTSLHFTPSALQASPYWQHYGAWAAAGASHAHGRIAGNQMQVPGSSFYTQAMPAAMRSPERVETPLASIPSRSGYTQGPYYSSQSIPRWRHPCPPPSTPSVTQAASLSMSSPSPLPSAPKWNSLWAYTAGLQAGRMMNSTGPVALVPVPSAQPINSRAYLVQTKAPGNIPCSTSNLYYRIPQGASRQEPLTTFKAPPPLRLFHDDLRRQHLFAIDASSPASG